MDPVGKEEARIPSPLPQGSGRQLPLCAAEHRLCLQGMLNGLPRERGQYAPAGEQDRTLYMDGGRPEKIVPGVEGQGRRARRHGHCLCA